MAQYFKNTEQKGSVRYIVFEDKEDTCWYAVGLEFNLVIAGDTPDIALLSLFDAINGYLTAFRKVRGARPHALNQTTDPEYEKMWLSTQKNKEIKTTYNIYASGVKVISHA